MLNDINMRLRAVFILIVCACAAVGVRGAGYDDPVSEEDEYFDLMGRADNAIERGDWEAAENALLRALDKRRGDPTNVLLLSNLGIVQYNLGRDSLALQALDRAHAIAPRSVTVLQNRAQVLMAMNRDEEAMADLCRVIELDSTLIEPLYMRSLLLLRMNRFDDARKDCERLSVVAPDSVDTHVAWGSLMSAREEWLEAARHYTEVIDKMPSASFYAARAVCWLMLDRLQDASNDIAEGLLLDPDNPELYFYRAHLNKMRYRREEALEDLRRSLRLSQRYE